MLAIPTDDHRDWARGVAAHVLRVSSSRRDLARFVGGPLAGAVWRLDGLRRRAFLATVIAFWTLPPGDFA